MVGMWRAYSFAVETGSQTHRRHFFPTGFHSQHLQEVFIANTCQVFSINIRLRTFFTHFTAL